MFNIVPQPNEMIITGGKTRFTLDEDTTITKAAFIDEFRNFVKSNSISASTAIPKPPKTPSVWS